MKQVAIQGKDFSLSYQELDALVSKKAKELKNRHTIFIATQDLESVLLILASWRQDRIACPLSPRLPLKAREKITQRMMQVETPLATLLLTSGTTGEPKLAGHSLENHETSAEMMIEQLELGPGDSYLLNLPLCHVAGIATCVRTFLAGATLVLDEEAENITHVSMVPTQLWRELERKTLSPKLKCLLLGGSPVAPSLLKKAEHLPVLVSYGMTEMSSTVAVGKEALTPLPRTEVRLDKEGQILTRGPTLFQGYEGKALKGEWFATGDIGKALGENSFRWIGRKDRQFISGGENIQPEEIERALMQIPGVLEAAIYGKPHEEFGVVPAAKITVEKSYTEEEIKEHLEENLPRFKIPKEIQLMRAQFQE